MCILCVCVIVIKSTYFPIIQCTMGVHNVYCTYILIHAQTLLIHFWFMTQGLFRTLQVDVCSQAQLNLINKMSCFYFCLLTFSSIPVTLNETICVYFN